jgi:hypothetical protein
MKPPFMLLPVLLLVCACRDQGTSFQGSVLGKFNYTAYDTLGTELYRGSIVLFQLDSEITGTWKFEDGRSGELEGTIRDGDISLNLNPGYVDNNLLLQGSLSGSKFSGWWQQIGFPGIMGQGRFIALKQ